MNHVQDIILKPIVTEKSSLQSENCNRFGFVVTLGSNKNQIKEAVEKLYDVRVLNVKTSIMPGKIIKAGKKTKKTTKTKKAFVQLSEGQKIEFFKGV